MIEYFKKYIADQNLLSRGDKILLAVSGGKDSVCMSHLFALAGFSFDLAHCNFKLRGEAADGDATFVQNLAQELGVECHIQSFETETFANTEKISIQMAARDLRYEWLEKIRSGNGYQYIATAHHLNDSIETVIYNFAKGCGIRGLHGILPKNGKIIRPLLFAEGAAIEAYIQSNSLVYREDASNASDKYSRNFIRHQIVPKLKELNPSFEKSAEETIQRIREIEFLFKQSIQQYRDLVLKEKGQEIYIDYHKIPKAAAPTILYELLKPMGFHGDQIKMMLRPDHQSGVSFYTLSHVLLIDRDRYIIRKNEIPKFVERDIPLGEEAVRLNDRTLSFSVLDSVPDPIPKAPSLAVLDFDKLTFPLQLRPWKAGDIFQPFGMQGKHQKVQDFLTNKKLSRFEKEVVHILESDGEICWVVGMRVDERFRIGEGTDRAYIIEVK
ncbi:MAG: tRNA(Ile)-lysidine synthase [Saprospiraceae bacterium]|jgi:tRNA(Ile)-lysidine synthase